MASDRPPFRTRVAMWHYGRALSEPVFMASHLQMLELNAQERAAEILLAHAEREAQFIARRSIAARAARQ